MVMFHIGRVATIMNVNSNPQSRARAILIIKCPKKDMLLSGFNTIHEEGEDPFHLIDCSKEADIQWLQEFLVDFSFIQFC